MVNNLTTKQIIIIIIVVIVILFLIVWLTSPNIQSFDPSLIKRTTQSYLEKNSINNSNGSNTNTDYVLYYFYNPKCGPCKAFTPTWNDTTSKLSHYNNLTIRSVDITNPENERLSFYHNVSHTPTIIMVTPSGNVKYNGNRTSDDFYNFIVNQMK